LDTEGSEFEILNAFDFSYTFDCITVEHSWWEEKRVNIKNLLMSKGCELPLPQGEGLPT
jgi:hypothetical protein